MSSTLKTALSEFSLLFFANSCNTVADLFPAGIFRSSALCPREICFLDFNLSAEPYSTFLESYEKFTDDPAVEKAVQYLKTGRLPRNFKWAYYKEDEWRETIDAELSLPEALSRSNTVEGGSSLAEIARGGKMLISLVFDRRSGRSLPGRECSGCKGGAKLGAPTVHSRPGLVREHLLNRLRFLASYRKLTASLSRIRFTNARKAPAPSARRIRSLASFLRINTCIINSLHNSEPRNEKYYSTYKL